MKNLIYGMLAGVLLFTPVFSVGVNSKDISAENRFVKVKVSSSKTKTLGENRSPASRRLSGKNSKGRRASMSSTSHKKSRKGKKPEEFSLGTLRKNHPLYRLGLRGRDVIKRVNGKEVSSKKSFLALLRQSKPGGKNVLKIERGGKSRNIYYTVKNQKTLSHASSQSRLSKVGDLRRFRLSKRSIASKIEKKKNGRYVSKKKKPHSYNAASGSRKLASLNKISKKRQAKANRKRVSNRKKATSRSLASKAKVKKLSSSLSDKTTTAKNGTSGGKNSLLNESAKKKEETVLNNKSAERKNNPPSPHLFDRLSQKEKKLLAKKSKYLQRAYVLQMNSQIYEKPHFDAQPIYIVPAGGKVLISRKIFTPPSKFGTFYKVFIHKDKKIVGYISEIDVVSQFERGNQNKINPRYAILKTRLSSGNKTGKIPSQTDKAKWPVSSDFPEKAAKKKKGNRFAGLSLLVKWDGEQNIKKFLAGVKFSGYGFLSSSLNMDMNIMSDVEFKQFYFDLLGIYEFIRGRSASLCFGGGLGVGIDRLSQQVTPGFAGSLGLRTVLLTGIFWQNELRISYEFDISEQVANYNYGFLTSFQFRF